MDTLLKYIYNYAFDKGFGLIKALINIEPTLVRQMSLSGMHFQIVDSFQGRASTMLQIVNLSSFFTNLAAELEYRLSRSASKNWQGVIEIVTGKEDVQLSVKDGKIEVTAGAQPDIAIYLDEYYLLNLVLGVMSFDVAETAFQKMVLTGDTDHSLLRDLFPGSTVYYQGVLG